MLSAEPYGWWTRVAEPLVLVATVVSYLTWTATTLASLHGADAGGQHTAVERVEVPRP